MNLKSGRKQLTSRWGREDTVDIHGARFVTTQLKAEEDKKTLLFQPGSSLLIPG